MFSSELTALLWQQRTLETLRQYPALLLTKPRFQVAPKRALNTFHYQHECFRSCLLLSMPFLASSAPHGRTPKSVKDNFKLIFFFIEISISTGNDGSASQFAIDIEYEICSKVMRNIRPRFIDERNEFDVIVWKLPCIKHLRIQVQLELFNTKRKSFTIM